MKEHVILVLRGTLMHTYSGITRCHEATPVDTIPPELSLLLYNPDLTELMIDEIFGGRASSDDDSDEI